MAEQTYDLTQTGAEVQAIINDAENCKGAGAQTTLTTEFVLLKDVNGQYHKILKSSFTEAIRDTLAGLLVNNDKGTTINQIAAIASGDFGSVTPANLASVLGAQVKATYTADNPLSDFNSLTTPGRYYFSVDASIRNAANKPESAMQAPAYLDVIAVNYRIYQRIVFLAGSSGSYRNHIYERLLGNPYTPWQRIDNPE